jgi:hypothetical protein
MCLLWDWKRIFKLQLQCMRHQVKWPFLTINYRHKNTIKPTTGRSKLRLTRNKPILWSYCVDTGTRLAKLGEECQHFSFYECYFHSHTRNIVRKIANSHCPCLHQTLMCTAWIWQFDHNSGRSHPLSTQPQTGPLNFNYRIFTAKNLPPSNSLQTPSYS